MYGRLGAAAGIDAGRAKGGRPPKSTGLQQQQMLKLYGEGKSVEKSLARFSGMNASRIASMGSCTGSY